LSTNYCGSNINQLSVHLVHFVSSSNQTAGNPESNLAVLFFAWITILATLGVALATLYQAYAAKQTVQEMKASRKLEQTPHLRFMLNVRELVVVFLKVVNIGKAAAVDIHITVVFKKDDKAIEERPYDTEAILPLESTELILPEPQFDYMLNKFTHIYVNGNYSDIFGQPYTVTQSIDVKKFVDSIKKAKISAGLGKPLFQPNNFMPP